MARFDHSVVALRVIGDDLVPDEVSVLLGAKPTHSFIKGQSFGRGLKRKAGMWRR
jgi:hypothetical protein